jgi:hypothetical protein
VIVLVFVSDVFLSTDVPVLLVVPCDLGLLHGHGHGHGQEAAF